jgi:hypothetical protein
MPPPGNEPPPKKPGIISGLPPNTVLINAFSIYPHKNTKIKSIFNIWQN